MGRSLRVAGLHLKAEWLEPVLLGDVEYRRKTAAGLLRHPSYKGLREDL
jgi:bifunctional non-homologous end joining protein LigD